MPNPTSHTAGPHDFGSPHPDPSDLAALLADGYLGSVWLTGQAPSRDLRRGRYTPESMKHPGKMLPTIPRYAIRTYTNPGDVVLDPWPASAPQSSKPCASAATASESSTKPNGSPRQPTTSATPSKPVYQAGARSTTATPPRCRPYCRQACTGRSLW